MPYTRKATLSNADELRALVEWVMAKGLNPTAISVGDCRIELMPAQGSGTMLPRDAGVSSMYEAYAPELVDDAFRQAHGNLPAGKDDLVPVVTG